MIEHTSRYYNLATTTFTDANGRDIAYIRRRFLPDASAATILAEHVVTQGERLDNITARYLTDSEQFWRVCDANDAMQPDKLTAEIGRRLRISYPQL
jgi:hypothetical protein